MTKQLEIPVKPDVLRWARETIGKTTDDVAGRLKISKEIVLGWEEGSGHPTLSQLRELAVYLKRPLAAFFLPSAPNEPALPGAFRRLPEDRREPLTKKTLLAIRRARRTQELARELAESEGIGESKLPVGRILLSDNPRAVAKLERERLGISVETQFRWGDKKEALRNWKEALESKGLIVLELNMPLKEARAVSLMDNAVPLVVINGRDAPAGQVFSLIHEYGHLLLGRSGIADFMEENRLTEDGRKAERFCDHFAGAFLVPEEDLLATGVVKAHGSGMEWEGSELSDLAALFNVSEYVIVRRLLMMGLASEEYYRMQAAKYDAENREMQSLKTYGRRVPAKACIRENGVPYTTMVFKAHSDERLTYRDVADYLYVKPKDLTAVADLLAASTAQ
jgi:Zn-dependent peptidase ImmA (M78 family)/transcriptional regulator with XRE-family HTH domain